MLVVWWLGAAATLPAQQPNVHYLHHGVMPPGAIGSQQLQRGGPLPGFFQPVEIKAPPGALISLATADQFDPARPGPRKAGFLIGAVYRLRVTNIRLAEGLEVFPTIEVIDRLYAPCGQECRFAIPVELTEEDLKLAGDGKFVTRVIYVEDPHNALPARDNPQGQNWFEAAPGQDPLAVADGLGRPVAILRLGARLPDQGMDRLLLLRVAAVCRLSAGAGLPNGASEGDRIPQFRPAPHRQAAAPKVTNLPPPPDQAEADAKGEGRGAKGEGWR